MENKQNSSHSLRILLTGGAGYIGSHMLLRLVEAGYRPIVIDKRPVPTRVNSLPFSSYILDIGNSDQLDRFFSKNPIDLVMHFAASTSVPESMKYPEKYYKDNFSTTLTLLNQMKRHKVKYCIFSSTAAIFGEPLYIPVDEEHPKSPVNPYGNSKLMCEMALHDYSIAYDIRSVCFRYFNAAGADPSGNAIFYLKKNSQLIPNVMSAVIGRESKVNIYGSDYETKDGTCERDYIHVRDICEAHLLAMQYLLSGGKSNCFNLGAEKCYSVLEVLSEIEKVTGKKIPIHYSGRRAGDMATILSDNKKAKKMLNWFPKYSELDIMIKDYWSWLLKLTENVGIL